MSNLPRTHPMSSLQHPMSGFQHPMSGLQHPMANLADPMSTNPHLIGSMLPLSSSRTTQPMFYMPHQQQDHPTAGMGRYHPLQVKLVLDITNPNCMIKDAAIAELSKNKELQHNLGPLLMISFGTMTELLKEIVSIYRCLSPPTLSPATSNKICNALSLLQCVASHQDTKMFFLQAHIPLFLYPFLNTTSRAKPFEYLRLTSLGVIGSLVKADSAEVVYFLISTEIVPLCLRTMELGCELSKSVATFIILKIILDDIGLQYIVAFPERFFAVGRVLGSMVASITDRQSIRLLKNIIRCYLRFSEDDRACETLRNYLPDVFTNGALHNFLGDDHATLGLLNQLIHNVNLSVGRHMLPRVHMM